MKVGDTLNDRFVLESVLSESPVGFVYKAVDLRQQEVEVESPYLAVKVLSTGISDNENLANELCRVSVAARMLQHPNILSFFEFDADGDVAYVTIPYIEGMPLSVYLEDKQLTETEIWRIGQDVWAGMTYAHGKGFVHGNISPDTVFVDSEGCARLFDIGLFELFRPMMGELTSDYISPEVKSGDAVSPADDLYSLSVLMRRLAV